MNFISEDIINPIIDQLSGEESNYERKIELFSEEQPFLLSFLLSGGFDVLEEEEKSLLFYLAMVIFYSIKSEYEEIDIIELEIIQKIDEENWTTVDQNKYKTLKEIADHYFEEYGQEDMLAFVEDALTEDEEYQISNIGRNVIFVSMKTIIDVFSHNLS